jgi:hypothetical protein
VKRLLLIFLLLPVLASGAYIEFDTLTLPYETAANYDTIVVNGSRTVTVASFLKINKVGVVLMGDSTGAEDTIFTPASGGRGLYFSYGNRNCIVKNLTIAIDSPVDTGVQGNTGTQTYSANTYVDDGNNLIFRNVNFVTGGYNGHNVTTAGNTHNVLFDNCNFTSKVWGFESRCDYDGSPLLLQGNLPSLDSGYHYTMYQCSVLVSPHSGVKASGKQHIYESYFIVDAHNWYYPGAETSGGICDNSVDPFAISCRGTRAGSRIHDNVIRSGTQFEGGQGIFIERCFGLPGDSIHIYDNNIHVHNGPNRYERTNGGWAFGMFSRSGPKYTAVYDNYVRVDVDSDSSTTWIGRIGHGAKFEFTAVDTSSVAGDTVYVDSIGYTTVERNIFEVYTLSDTGSQTGVGMSRQQTIDNLGNIFRENDIGGGYHVIEIGTDNGTGGGIQMDACSLYWGGGYPQKTYTYMFRRQNRYNYDNVFTDMAYGTDVSDTSIDLTSVPPNSGYEHEISLASTYKVYARGNNDSAIVGANVYVEDQYDNSWSGVTGSNGLKEQEVTYWFEAYYGTDSTAFNPCSVWVWLDSDSSGTVQVFEKTIGHLDSSKVDTVDFDVAGTGSWDAEEVNQLSAFSADSVYNDGAVDTIEVTTTTTAQTFDSNGTIVLAWSSSTYPSDISDSDLVITYHADSAIVTNITFDGTETYTLYISAWVVGATSGDVSDRSITSIEFTAGSTSTDPLLSLSVDSLHNDYTGESELDSFRITFSTDTQTLEDSPIIVLAWSTSGYPSALSDTTSGGTSFAYVADSSGWVVDVGAFDGTETYTIYVRGWVYDGTSGTSTPVGDTKLFTAAEEPDAENSQMKSGIAAGGIIR